MEDKIVEMLSKLDGISSASIQEALRWIHIKQIMAFWLAIACFLIWIAIFILGYREWKKDEDAVFIMPMSFFFFIAGVVMVYQYWAYKIHPHLSAIRMLING